MLCWRRLTVAGLLLILQAGCTGLVRDDGVYSSKAGRTAEVVASSVQTARYAVQALEEGLAPGRYVVQLLDEAEEQAGSAQGTFDAIQPPGTDADELRDAYVSAILSGPGALAARISGRNGGWLESIANRLFNRADTDPPSIPFGVVKRVHSAVDLSVPASELESLRTERWLRDHVVEHLPGADDAPE
jgi:hypothetical protein